MKNHTRFLRLLILGLTTLSVVAPASSQAAYFYTDNAVAGARANLQNLPWAKEKVEEMKAYAQPWLQMSYDEVWNFLTEQSVPRSAFVGKPPRCPIHGSLEAHGVYAYDTSPSERFKVRCPIGGETWPTNDYEAYYKSGKNSRNEFEPQKAKRNLLRSNDPSRSYGVDDGTGYKDGKGNTYHFVGYYAFWGVWNRVTRSDFNAITNLSQLYTITGDVEYGRRAALLLARATDLYAKMNTGYWSAKGVSANDGGTNMGQVLGNIWDDEVANNLMMAYDALESFIETDSETQKLLGAYSARYGLTPQATGAQIQNHIHTNLFAPVRQAVKERRIRSNEGRAQYTMGLAGLMAGGAGLQDALNWLFSPGDNFKGGGHLPHLFWNLVDRDGAGTESSPYYNGVWMEALMPLARILNLTEPEGDILEEYPHIRKLLLYPGRLMNHGGLFPHISDAGTTGKPELPVPDLVAKYVEAYLQFGLEDAAMLAYKLNGETTKDLHGGLFDGDAKVIQERISSVVAKRGRQWELSDNMNAYGLAQHRAGQRARSRTMWLYWGRTGHGGNHPQFDRLNLGLFAFGTNLLPDLGYPEYPVVWDTNQGWMKNTISHNTVVVDAGRQHESFSGDQRIFADTPYVQFSEVDGGGVYPQTSMYRRSVAMIQIDNDRSYAVDLFRVKGGSDHVYSLHAAEGPATAEGLNLRQRGGTYAREDVPYGKFYDQPLSSKYMGSGFQFLDKVETDASAPESFSVDWQIADTHGTIPAELEGKVHVRATMLGNEGEVSLANGYPAQNNGSNPDSLRYLLVRNRGSNLTSRFVGVIEPYLANPAVKSAVLLPLKEESSDAMAVAVVLDTGRVDYIFSTLDGKTHQTEDGRFTFAGTYGVYAEVGGEMAFSFLAEEGEIQADGQIVATATSPAGNVLNVDAMANGTANVTVDNLIPDDGSFHSSWIDFQVKGERDANFKVTDIKNAGGVSTLTLGDADIYTGYRSEGDYDSGLVSIIQNGTPYKFPMIVYERGPAYEWLSDDFSVASDGRPVASASGWQLAGAGCQSAVQYPGWMVPLGLPLFLRFLRRTRRKYASKKR